MTAEEENYALIVRNLVFAVNDVEILKGVDLAVKKGEFAGLIGPNGAGKTTLLKCINGINRSQGCVIINEENLNSMNDRKIARKVALMHQNSSINFPFPAMDVVMLGRYSHLKRMQAERGEDFEIVRKYMKYTDTEKFKIKPITQISGGERQRVFFAKVLAQETDMLLLDEPTASLDITHQEQIFKYARELSDSGKTVIAAVHDLKIASRYCTRLILMKEGRIVADGSPDEVLTSRNISETYGVNALVYRNRITGLLDFYIHRGHNEWGGCKVHVIGGGGSASGIIRQLFENGFKVSAGVFSPADSDLQCAQVFGIEHVVCKPFSDICEASLASNIDKVRKADMTVLCDMPFGHQNIRNLEAASYAGKLIIIEDDPPEARDFTGGKALELYRELKKKAVVTTSAMFHEVMWY